MESLVSALLVIYEDQGFDQMAKDVVSYMQNRHPDYDGTFKVYTRRAKKSYPITSMEVSAATRWTVSWMRSRRQHVDVHEPELTLSVEIRDKIYVYSETTSRTGRNADRNKRKSHASPFRRY